MARLKLDELAGGAAQEKFDRSFSKVAQNLMDVNCPSDKKRTITMQFEFSFKDESRSELEVKIHLKSHLLRRCLFTHKCQSVRIWRLRKYLCRNMAAVFIRNLR